MPKPINFKRDITRPLLLAIFVLSLSLSWLFITAYNLLQTQVEIAKIDDFRFKLISVERHIIDAETAQRGYLITNNPTFLEPYLNGEEKVIEIINSLEKSDLGIPELPSRILQLRALSSEKFRIINASIQVQLNAGSYASHLTLSKDKGELVMKKFQQITAEMDAWLTLIKNNISNNADLILTKVILGSIVLIIVISGILLFSYRRTISMFEQVIENRIQSEQLSFEADHDPLTKLANRRSLNKHLRSIHSISRRMHDSYAVFFMDLDGFKQINDKLGHEIGDAVLIRTSELFRSVLRETDFLSRVGGDEFILIIHRFTNDSELSQLAERILLTLEQPIEIMQKRCQIGVSIGIARYPFNNKHLDDVLQMADKAMYESKKAGKNQYKFA